MAFKHPNCGGNVHGGGGSATCNECGETFDVLCEQLHYPERLKRHNQWVCWRIQCGKCGTTYDDDRDECVCGTRMTKVLYDARTDTHGSPTDPTTWTTFETARRSSDGYEGVGFVFNEESPFVGVDLDDCRDPETGELTDWARDIVNRLDSFTEISTSGTGVHVYCVGDKPDGRNKVGGVEMYDEAKFFGMTGRWLSGTPREVKVRDEEITAVFEDYLQSDSDGSRSNADYSSDGNDLSDDEVLEYAFNSKNSDTFKELWDGGLAGYESHSEARMALLCNLAFWTGGDMGQMNSLYERSGLHPHPTKPGKWERVRDIELRRAVRFQDDFFGVE